VYDLGTITATTFGYINSSTHSDSVYRGVTVDIVFDTPGSYTVFAYDLAGAVSTTSITIGGMDTLLPEIPEFSVLNDGNKTLDYYNLSNNNLKFSLEIYEAESVNATPVTYTYNLYKKDSHTDEDYNPIPVATGILDGDYISVYGGVQRTVSLYDITNGCYFIEISCVDGAGNVGIDEYSLANTKGFEFTVCSTTPQVSLQYKIGSKDYVSGDWANRTIAVNFALSNDSDSFITEFIGVTYYYKIGANGTFTSIGKNRNKLILGDNEGDINDTVYFYAVTGSGKQSAISSYVIRIDQTKPEDPISYGYLDYDTTINGASALDYTYPWGQAAGFDIDNDNES
jgi:hypothetical protein